MEKITELKKILKENKIDYFILPNNDEFSLEYLPQREKRIEFLTGFNGSNAIVIIKNKGKNAFFTDGRYILQAKEQLARKYFDIFDLSQKSLIKYLVENAKENQNIAIDGKLHSAKQANLIKGHIEALKANLTILKENPLDKIWENRPQISQNPVFLFKSKYSGQKVNDKIIQTLKNLHKNSDALLLNCPASINWLLNIRSSDIECTPLAVCYCILYKNGKIDLFLEEKRCDKEVKKYFKNNKINIINPKQLENSLKSLKNKVKTIELDDNNMNFAIFNLLNKEKIEIITKDNPILALKAIKNEIEIKNNIIAHEKDGLALTKFLFWLENQKNNDELTASEQLLEFRKLDKDFIYPSFDTISSFGANGAIIHYKANKKTNKKFTKNNLYLVDSGGQYYQGTTDITRTILIGKAKKEHIENFTRVLKGHIAIARTKFPLGTKGSQLDILARNFLWQDFKDYAHGTGHGVGQFLSVHESPPGISKTGSELKENMILSNEPGYYEDGKYGIRIENLMVIIKSKNKNFLEFRTLSLAPIDYRLINFKMMTYPEKKWLKEYHNEIYKKLSIKLEKNGKAWLKELCQKYSSYTNYNK